MNCRYCNKELTHLFLDLGFAPPSNAYLTKSDLNRPEKYYPLRVKVCDQCWLVQTEDYTRPQILFSSDYAYFSSTSQSWLKHAKCYAEKINQELGLSETSLVIEVACNDGYLLKNFIAMNIPCLGIEPTDSTAATAEKLGIPVLREFFTEQLGEQLASRDQQADLIVANNVFAHVPDIIDFTKGLKKLLRSNGTITLEFPHLMRLIDHCQFDTVYHEHFSYLSLHIVSKVFESVGLRIWNVEELATHGGSLRVYGCHDYDTRIRTDSVNNLLKEEKRLGLQSLSVYENFQLKTEKIKNDLLLFLIDKKNKGKTVVAYGAAAKGSTLLNYAGVKIDLLPMIFDAAEAKQLKYMPGSHIPILPPLSLRDLKPDYLLILPWNIATEVIDQNNVLVENGTKFVTAVPELNIL